MVKFTKNELIYVEKLCDIQAGSVLGMFAKIASDVIDEKQKNKILDELFVGYMICREISAKCEMMR